ncbi:HAD hydrolase-like protein [Candidatus Woesearchaeota archaeon]|nr:HAD hydrolase-like protein [Candidatus Woesearchaeota archaeon]
MTKAIISDGGDILFTSKDKEVLYSFLSKYIPNLTFGAFRTGFKPYRSKSNEVKGYSVDDAVRDYIFENDFNGGIFDEYMISRERMDVLQHKNRVVREGVKETLEELKHRGVYFIVATDASLPGRILRPQLVPLGLSGLVYDIVSSTDVGAQKPNPKFFNRVLRANDLKRDEVFFVGHDEDELRGAYEQGFEVVALNYDPKEDLSFISEDHKVEKFPQILKFVKT